MPITKQMRKMLSLLVCYMTLLSPHTVNFSSSHPNLPCTRHENVDPLMNASKSHLPTHFLPFASSNQSFIKYHPQNPAYTCTWYCLRILLALLPQCQVTSSVLMIKQESHYFDVCHDHWPVMWGRWPAMVSMSSRHIQVAGSDIDLALWSMFVEASQGQQKTLLGQNQYAYGGTFKQVFF